MTRTLTRLRRRLIVWWHTPSLPEPLLGIVYSATASTSEECQARIAQMQREDRIERHQLRRLHRRRLLAR